MKVKVECSWFQQHKRSILRKVKKWFPVFKYFSDYQVEKQVPSCSAAQAIKPKPLSSTPGAVKKVKHARTKIPDDVAEFKSRKIDREATDSIKAAADKIMDAAMLFINCMNDLRPELRALSNRNYREIQTSTNAFKQLVSENKFNKTIQNHKNVSSSKIIFYSKIGDRS